ncbi:MAG: hypothetical protein KDC80_03810, partial [Saprospiraceae bacterium]|nr:hypothetical protein [Saprospiraceae bacterium]
SDDLLIHEYVHILHWNIAGDPNLIPKWLWEGVALYKGCCQWDHLEQLEYLQKEKFPSLREINGQAELQYQLGYSIIEFIVEKWDWAKVLSLLKNNGDIKESLDLSTRALEREFYAFIKEKYLSK